MSILFWAQIPSNKYLPDRGVRSWAPTTRWLRLHRPRNAGTLNETHTKKSILKISKQSRPNRIHSGPGFYRRFFVRLARYPRAIYLASLLRDRTWAAFWGVCVGARIPDGDDKIRFLKEILSKYPASYENEVKKKGRPCQPNVSCVSGTLFGQINFEFGCVFTSTKLKNTSTW